jgi:integrase
VCVYWVRSPNANATVANKPTRAPLAETTANSRIRPIEAVNTGWYIVRLDRKLALKLDGSQMAATTANRIRIVARACIQSAIAAGAVTADVWPQRSKSRARRKVARTRRSVDIRTLPSPAVMAAAIDAIVTQQPGSKTSRVMTAVAYYAGLRPSEVVMLRVPLRRTDRAGLGTSGCHRGRYLLRRTRRTEDRAPQRANPAGARGDVARVGRRERSQLTRASAVPDPQRHHAKRIELGASLAPRA